jgi:hypothetical protein
VIGILQGMRVPRRAPALFRVKVGVEFSKNGSFQKSVRSKVSDSFCSGFVTTCETESRSVLRTYSISPVDAVMPGHNGPLRWFLLARRVLLQGPSATKLLILLDSQLLKHRHFTHPMKEDVKKKRFSPPLRKMRGW